MSDHFNQNTHNYYEDRSEQWQESEKAEEFLAKQERLQEIIDLLQEIN